VQGEKFVMKVIDGEAVRLAEDSSLFQDSVQIRLSILSWGVYFYSRVYFRRTLAI
jgi:hypothetical protein